MAEKEESVCFYPPASFQEAEGRSYSPLGITQARGRGDGLTWGLHPTHRPGSHLSGKLTKPFLRLASAHLSSGKKCHRGGRCMPFAPTSPMWKQFHKTMKPSSSDNKPKKVTQKTLSTQAMRTSWRFSTLIPVSSHILKMHTSPRRCPFHIGTHQCLQLPIMVAPVPSMKSSPPPKISWTTPGALSPPTLRGGGSLAEMGDV